MMNNRARVAEELSHDLVALAFESSSDCIKMISAEGTLLVINAGGAAAMGFPTPASPVGKNWIEFWQGHEREAARHAVTTAANGGQAVVNGYLPTVTGVPKWWESTIVPIPVAGSKPENLLVISRDVTEQRKAEHARQKSEKLYKTLVEATSAIVWSRDLEVGKCLSCGWTEFTGETNDASDVQGWLRSVHPDDRERTYQADLMAKHHGQPLRVEYRLRCKSEGWRWVEDHAVPVKNDNGIITGWVGVVTDINDRKVADQALRSESERLRLALEAAALGTWDVDLQTGTCRLSTSSRQMLGLTDDPSNGNVIDVLHPDDRNAVVERYRSNLTKMDGMSESRFRIVRPDTGETRWIASKGRAVLDDAGQIIQRFGTFEDFTERKQTRDALRATLRRYQALLDATSVVVWHSDAAQEICERQGWAEFTGQHAFEGDNVWLEVIHPADRARVKEIRDNALERGVSYTNEYRLSHVAGEHRWVRDDVSPLFSDGLVDGWVGIISDIHERRTAEQALQASEGRLRLASEVAGLGTYDVDLLIGKREWSPEFYDLLRLPQTIAPCRQLFIDAVHIDDRAQLLDDLQVSEEADGTLRVSTFRLVFPSGDVRWMEERERLFLDGAGRPTRRVGTMQDITYRKQAEHKLWLAAHADALTGLANRTLFQSRLGEAVARADLQGTEVGLLIVDVDRFKEINDTMGHDAGDAVLRAMADRLRHFCPPNATVARLGGDEFGVVIPIEPSHIELKSVGEGILVALRQPVVHDGREIECSGSVGWAVYPRQDPNASMLLKNADMALYTAKNAGRNCVASFDAPMRESLKRRVNVLRSAKDALSQGAVFPFYQPKVSIQTGQVVGFEALLRWRNALGVRPPSELQDAFVDPELACRLGAQMLRCTIEDMVGWTDSGVSFGQIALNAGAPELHRSGFADGILQSLARAGLSTSQFEIEVTEGVLMDDATSAITKALRTLDKAGVSISLDDFGTGYASLIHLKRFPVSWLKVDRSFVSNMETDDDARAIVKAVASLAHSLGMKTVAEGAESLSQVNILADIGCELVQGYVIAKPMAAADVPAFLRGWNDADPGWCSDGRPVRR